MNKVLFVHDGPLIVNSKNEYYGLDYNNLVVERYLNLGNEVTFLMRVKKLEDTSNFSHISNSNFRVIKIPETKDIKNYFKNKSAMENIVKKAVENSDVIIVRLPSMAGMVAYKFAEKAKKKIIVEVVACAFEGYFHHSNIGKIIAPYMYLKTKKIIKKAPFTSYVTNKYLQKKYPNRNNVLACSDVVLSNVNENDLAHRNNKIMQMSMTHRYTFGSIGSIDINYKGHRHVIKAISILKEKGYNIEYVIVGNGKKSTLEKLIRKYKLENEVKLVGALPHNEISFFLKKIDLYIQPSDVESHGRVILEAFAVGAPVIGSSTGGIPELLEPSYIFLKRDVADLVKVIERVLQENSRSELLDNSNRNFEFVKSYELSKLNSKRNAFYKKVLAKEVLE